MKNNQKKWIFAVLITLASIAVDISQARADLVVNGSFENTSSFNGTYQNFSTSGVQAWDFGTQSLLLAPGYADTNGDLPVYGPFPNSSPDGGNFYESQASPGHSDSIEQTISGLTEGMDYAVSFFQAAGQLQGGTGSTTETWSVTFGDEQHYSDPFVLDQGAVGNWQKQTMRFTATSDSQELTFTSIGTSDFTHPVIFLDGVSVEFLPLPNAFISTMVLLVGVVGLNLIPRRKRSGGLRLEA